MKKAILAVLVLSSSLAHASRDVPHYLCKTNDGKITIEFDARLGDWKYAIVPQDISMSTLDGRKERKMFVAPTLVSIHLSPPKNPTIGDILSEGSILKKNVFGKKKIDGSYRFSLSQSINGKTVSPVGSGTLDLTSDKHDLTLVNEPISCIMD